MAAWAIAHGLRCSEFLEPSWERIMCWRCEPAMNQWIAAPLKISSLGSRDLNEIRFLGRLWHHACQKERHETLLCATTKQKEFLPRQDQWLIFCSCASPTEVLACFCLWCGSCLAHFHVSNCEWLCHPGHRTELSWNAGGYSLLCDMKKTKEKYHNFFLVFFFAMTIVLTILPYSTEWCCMDTLQLVKRLQD